MTFYQWLTLGLGAVGFIATWVLGAFKLGRAVEQMKDDLKEHVDAEIEELRKDFAESQKSQDHNFGEVGAAMRQKIADVEKHVREVEIWGRDNYVKQPEFTAAMDRFREDLKDAVAEIKKDMREIITRN